jgi:hypothetical protein
MLEATIKKEKLNINSFNEILKNMVQSAIANGLNFMARYQRFLIENYKKNLTLAASH